MKRSTTFSSAKLKAIEQRRSSSLLAMDPAFKKAFSENLLPFTQQSELLRDYYGDLEDRFVLGTKRDMAHTMSRHNRSAGKGNSVSE